MRTTNGGFDEGCVLLDGIDGWAALAVLVRFVFLALFGGHLLLIYAAYLVFINFL